MTAHRVADVIGGHDVAIVLPCRNAGLAIASVVIGFQRTLPGATIYVFDNGSDDNTAHMARAAGARVIREPRAGTGDLALRIFSAVDADLYILADGNGAYDPADAPALIETLIDTGADMVVGARGPAHAPAGQGLRETLMAALVPALSESGFSDWTSGFRVFTRRFARSCAATTGRRKIGMDLSLHAWEVGMPTAETTVAFVEAPEGAATRASRWRGGIVALGETMDLIVTLHPLALFAALSALLSVPAIALAGLAIAAAPPFGAARLAGILVSGGFGLAALIVGACGLVLDGLNRVRLEQKRLAYLSCPAFPAGRAAARRPIVAHGEDDPTLQAAANPTARYAERAANAA